MQGPTSASPPPAPNQTIHSPFTPRLHTPRPGHHDIVHSLEMGSYAHKNSGVYPAALLDFSQPQEEVLSQGMTVTSSVCIPTLDEPEPALRSPSSVDSWERQIALASGGLAAKRSDVSILHLVAWILLTCNPVTKNESLATRGRPCTQIRQGF